MGGHGVRVDATGPWYSVIYVPVCVISYSKGLHWRRQNQHTKRHTAKQHLNTASTISMEVFTLKFQFFAKSHFGRSSIKRIRVSSQLLVYVSFKWGKKINLNYIERDWFIIKLTISILSWAHNPDLSISCLKMGLIILLWYDFIMEAMSISLVFDFHYLNCSDWVPLKYFRNVTKSLH